jgi:hypothetical protein
MQTHAPTAGLLRDADAADVVGKFCARGEAIYCRAECNYTQLNA